MKTFSILTAGDVMVGRGIDQIFEVSSDPLLFETFVKDARTYIQLANSRLLLGEKEKKAKIQIPMKQKHAYLWEKFNPGNEKRKRGARLLVANLETSITISNKAWPNKGINYRMHPENASLLVEGGFDILSLANNHVCDYGREGLLETLQVLEKHNIQTVGAGKNLKEAQKPAVFVQVNRTSGKTELVVLVFAFAHPSSGVPKEWQASDSESGVWIFFNLDDKDFLQVARVVETTKKTISKSEKCDEAQIFVMFMVHWLPNWVDDVSNYPKVTNFSHRLTNELNVQLIHSTSPHHALSPEIQNGSLIVYGSGDLVNDYEGIEKSVKDHGTYHSECGFLYETTWKEIKKKEEKPKKVGEKSGWELQKAQLIALEMHAFQLTKSQTSLSCARICTRWTRQGGIFC